MPTYRLDLGYDGSGFRGFARNEGVRTVQGELEAALGRVTGDTVSLVVAGRTDAGVHARRQVVSFESSALEADRVVRSLRTMLGPEISIHSMADVDADFSARFSATWRRYRYFLDEGEVQDPLRRNWVWHVAETLDLDAMNRAAVAFVGSHDFASLCRSSEGRTTERTVFEAEWSRTASATVYEVRAGAFCQQMVRSMVALCVDVGRGRVEAGSVGEILGARDRHAARGVSPPHGLVLWEVGYD